MLQTHAVFGELAHHAWFRTLHSEDIEINLTDLPERNHSCWEWHLWPCMGSTYPRTRALGGYKARGPLHLLFGSLYCGTRGAEPGSPSLWRILASPPLTPFL